MKLTGKMVAIRSGHFRDHPWNQMAKNLFLSVFLRELPGKIMAIGSGHFGDPPWGQMSKTLFLSVFLKKLPGKIMANGSGNFEDPPRGQNAKKIVFVIFSQKTFWKNSGHRKATPDDYYFSREPWQKLFFVHVVTGRIPKVATSNGHNFSSKFPKKVQFLAIGRVLELF